MPAATSLPTTLNLPPGWQELLRWNTACGIGPWLAFCYFLAGALHHYFIYLFNMKFGHKVHIWYRKIQWN